MDDLRAKSALKELNIANLEQIINKKNKEYEEIKKQNERYIHLIESFEIESKKEKIKMGKIIQIEKEKEKLKFENEKLESEINSTKEKLNKNEEVNSLQNKINDLIHKLNLTEDELKLKDRTIKRLVNKLSNDKINETKSFNNEYMKIIDDENK